MDDQSSSDDHDRPTAVVSPPGIEAESLPLMDFVDSCTESCSNSEIFDISPQEFKMEEQEVDEDEEEEEVQELDKKEKNIKQQDFKKPSSSTELRTPGGRRRTPESPRCSVSTSVHLSYVTVVICLKRMYLSFLIFTEICLCARYQTSQKWPPESSSPKTTSYAA